MPVASASVKCVAEPFPDRFKPPADDPMTMTIPNAPVTHGAATCRGDREVWRDEAGRIRVCTLASAATVEGVAIAADAYTHFHANGVPYQTTIASDRSFKSGSDVEIPCKGGELVVLSDKGALDFCTLGKPMVLDGTSCAPGQSVALRPNGRLHGCTLAEAISGMGIEIHAGVRVSFHPSGALASAFRPEQTIVHGYRVQYEVEIHENGELAHITLLEPRTIAAIELPERAEVWMRPDKSVWHIEYVADDGFMPHGEMWTDTRKVTFDCEQRIVADVTDHWMAERRR
ncbi:MAG: hypothetical protein HOV80_02000 [Polyangiaceae bacterium]|nr:hypothetical protein [Polyangiaceae bacterium]